MTLVIDAARCPQSHHCPLIVACPAEAIAQRGFGLPVIDAQRCIECGACVDSCAMGAVYKEQ